MSKKQLTQTQIDKIPFDYGMLYVDYGIATQAELAPLSGGGKFEQVNTWYDIPFEGAKGMNKGMKALVKAEAKITTNLLNTDITTMHTYLAPYADLTSAKIALKATNMAVAAATTYPTNITFFIHTVDGKWLKITLNSPFNGLGLSIEAKEGVEGMVPVQFDAHWDPLDTTKDLFDMEVLDAIVDPYVAP